MKNCEQFRELIEAYALGALDADERVALDTHLASGCVDCARSIEDARLVVTHLAYLAPEQMPSSALKDRLMRAVRAEAQASRLSASRKPAIWAWIGVAALVALTVYSAWDAWRLQSKFQEANDQTAKATQNRQMLQEQLALAQREVTILTDPASVCVIQAGTRNEEPSSDRRLKCRRSKWIWSPTIVAGRPQRG